MPNLLSRGLFNLFFGKKRSALAALPGPEPGVLGTATDFFGPPPWDVCARYGREYGGVTLIWLGGTPALVLNDPHLIEQVLDSRRTEFEKSSIIEQIKPSTTEHSVFIATQRGNWAEMRRADPFEQPWIEAWLAAQVGPMKAAIQGSVGALRARSSGASIDLVQALRRLTFDAFAVAGVGEELPDSLYDDFILLATGADIRIKAKIPLRFVRPPKGFEAAKARFYGHFAARVSAARRAPNPAATDLLSWMLREAPGIDDDALAHIVGLMFFGGVFSSSTTLVGAFHQLAKYPATDERLAAEAAALAEGELTLERLRGARWIEAVTYEAMRILPAVRITIRVPIADTELAGVTLPAGTTLLISNQHLHRDPAHWPNPDVFDPARWLDGGVARDPLGSGYFFPFMRGPRACVAANFAMVFMQTAIATVAAQAKVHVDSTEPFEEDMFFGVVLPKRVTGKLIAR
ncbi:cytochrome P450 [Sorangium cellulosum]|uniref:Cytochrome P450 n=1 Tax=Sorangium cellulosum TaxID=56 RepID=A0A2L0ESU9_SORCE|nr:cytochrome P450 [Sorangium cellulosum]AUX42369.1 cytochrome P450 [Sorangium cellulosum]